MRQGVLYGMITVESSFNYTVKAIESFFKYTKLQPYDRFILIDNDGYYTEREGSKNYTVQNKIKLNTSSNINQIIEFAKDEKQSCIFLSNDIVLTPNWHDRLIIDNNILTIPSCNQTHNYGFSNHLSLEEFNNQHGKLNTIAHQHHSRYNILYEKLIMPTYVCHIPYNIYSQVGFFDESFNVGGEDVDYRIRLLQHGFDIKYCSSFVLHFNGKSSWNGVETEQETIERDRNYISKFIDKHGKDLFNLCITHGNPNITIEKYNLHEYVKNQQFNKMILQVLKNG